MKRVAIIGGVLALAAGTLLLVRAPEAQSHTEASYPARIALPVAATIPAQAATTTQGLHRRTAHDSVDREQGAQWELSANQRRATYGIPGASPVVSLACNVDTHGSAKIVLSRYTPAEPGAKALFALVGPRQVSRIKVAAKPLGATPIWEGSTPALDDAWTVFAPGGAIVATVPGGGAIQLSASGEPARLVEECRRADTSAPAPTT